MNVPVPYRSAFFGSGVSSLFFYVGPKKRAVKLRVRLHELPKIRRFGVAHMVTGLRPLDGHQQIQEARWRTAAAKDLGFSHCQHLAVLGEFVVAFRNVLMNFHEWRLKAQRSDAE